MRQQSGTFCLRLLLKFKTVVVRSVCQKRQQRETHPLMQCSLGGLQLAWQGQRDDIGL